MAIHDKVQTSWRVLSSILMLLSISRTAVALPQQAPSSTVQAQTSAAVQSVASAVAAGAEAAAAAAAGQDIKAQASSISALLSSPTFVAYSKPNQKVEEWIALGDSYTAGTGCNGLGEIIGGGDAARGQRSYPMQMSTDKDGWDFINGDDTLPRFSFSAYTGDTTVELVTQQLKQGDFKDNNKDVPRHPFGKPQLATVTIGGNDAKLSTILNNCIYRAWFPGDCQKTLQELDQALNDGSLREKINVGLFNVANAGRQAGGANPRESFQVFVTSYISFFNDANPECNDISWGAWPFSKPKLTTDLRKQLNSFTVRVNDAVKQAAKDLERMGVIYIDGLEDTYKGHRYCEPGHTNAEMVDYDTWFWSPYSRTSTPSEGPGDPNAAYDAAASIDTTQVTMNFLFPDGSKKVEDFSESSPPWEEDGVKQKFPTFEAFLQSMAQDGNVTVSAVPFSYLRSFHPKGTAYGHHKDLFMGVIADNRQVGAQNAPTPTPQPTPTPSPQASCPVSNDQHWPRCEECPNWEPSPDRCIASEFSAACTCPDPCGKVNCIFSSF